ncbi:unnamed protein product [Orchesella dallaii]|uniref:Uncharacterized protein n=1 Tax=Orchesella dallaii TaxID=48710 RepID=A0ABP1QGH4_9HEXA
MTMQLDHNLRDQYYDKRRSLSTLELGFLTVLPSCYLQGISFVLFGLFRPDLPFFHCSLLKELGWPLWAQIPIKLYESFMLINCWNVIAPVWLIFLTPGYSIFGWTHELPQSKRTFQTFETLRKYQNSVKVYKYLQILSDHLLRPVKTYLLGVSFFVGSIVVVMMGYATVRELGETPMPQYLAYPTSWLFVALIFSFVGTEAERWNMSSMTYLRDLKQIPSKQLKMEGRSFRPMVMKISDVQSATKGFTVSKLNHACDAIIDLLVSSK